MSKNREMGEEANMLCKAYTMQGGDGPYCYATNSTYSRLAMESGKEFVNKAIAEELDVGFLLSSINTFKIADLGCSVGPNTFFAVENIIEAVELKYQSQGMHTCDRIPEFQVFFNDQIPNDFNLLFKLLPHNRPYYAVGVPGSFYGRIFPKSSIHFAHSSFAIHRLSRIPKTVVDKNSPAWNKGHIHFANSSSEVARAFEAQHAEDMDCFLHARAQEIVCGGLMVLIITGRPNGTPHSQCAGNVSFQLMESCLKEMARKGVVSEVSIDTFNIPMYVMSPNELEAAVDRNGGFSLVKMKTLPHVSPPGTVSVNQLALSTMKASMWGIFKPQFGDEILDEFFDLYFKKLEEDPSIGAEATTIKFLAVLKRKEN